MSRRPKPHWRAQPAPADSRPIPEAPEGLGPAGQQAWEYIWKPEHHWIAAERHLLLVSRYCQVRDLLAAAIAQVRTDGFMVEGSTGRQRAHPCLAEIRALATESRRTEIELGLTPSSESKVGVTPVKPRSSLDDMFDWRRTPEDDDFRIGLKAVTPDDSA